MRWSALMIVCVLALVPFGWGQRGGGFHSSGGFHSAGGFASRGSMHSGGMSFAHAHPGFGSRNGFHPGHGPVHTGRDFDRHRFPRRFGFYPYGAYPYAYGGYGWPFWWDWSNSSYDDSRDNDRGPYNDAQYQTAAEINRLADQVEELRQDRYNQPAPAPAAPAPRPEAKLEQDLPVVLVFLDRHIQEVKNYAVAHEMLIVLDGSRRTKYPLADIDLAATMKLNDERGVDFEVPNPVITQ